MVGRHYYGNRYPLGLTGFPEGIQAILKKLPV